MAVSRSKYFELEATGAFDHFCPGTWLAVDSELGLISANKELEVVIDEANTISDVPCIIQYRTRPVIHRRQSVRHSTSADGLGLGKEPAGARVIGAIFNHTLDSRAYSYCHSRKATGAGSSSRNKLLLDWGSTITWVPSRPQGARAGPQQWVEVAGGDAQIFDTIVVWVEFCGLRTRVDAILGDRILGTDVLARYNHTINPVAGAGVGWWTVVVKAGEFVIPSVQHDSYF